MRTRVSSRKAWPAFTASSWIRGKVATNIVVFDIGATGLTSGELSRRLKQRGVLINGIGHSHMRAVTHYDVTRAECAQAVETLAEAVARVAIN